MHNICYYKTKNNVCQEKIIFFVLLDGQIFFIDKNKNWNGKYKIYDGNGNRFIYKCVFGVE